MKRDDPDDESVDDAVETFMDCFEDAQCGGPKARTRFLSATCEAVRLPHQRRP